MEPRARKALYRTAVLLVVAGLVLFLATLFSVLRKDGLASADDEQTQWLVNIRSEPMTTAMIIVAIVFGPVAMPVVVFVVTATWVVVAKHAWRPVLLAGAMLTGVGLAQVISRSVGRPRPPVELMLFGADYTFSFPSGHVLGASNFLLITTFLVFSRHKNPKAAVLSFIVAAACVVLTAVCRLYLGYHWVSDAIASVSLSLVVLGGVMALDTWRTARVPGEGVTGEWSVVEPAGTSESGAAEGTGDGNR